MSTNLETFDHLKCFECGKKTKNAKVLKNIVQKATLCI